MNAPDALYVLVVGNFNAAAAVRTTVRGNFDRGGGLNARLLLNDAETFFNEIGTSTVHQYQVVVRYEVSMLRNQTLVDCHAYDSKELVFNISLSNAVETRRECISDADVSRVDRFLFGSVEIACMERVREMIRHEITLLRRDVSAQLQALGRASGDPLVVHGVGVGVGFGNLVPAAARGPNSQVQAQHHLQPQSQAVVPAASHAQSLPLRTGNGNRNQRVDDVDGGECPQPEHISRVL